MKTFDIFDSEDHITDAAVRSSATNLLPTSTVLVVTRSGILRHTFPVAVARVPVTLNQDLKGITPHGGIKPAYLARALTAFGHRIIHSCTKDGTTVQSIETSLLQKFEIPLAPEREQQRILDTLDELLSDLDAGVAALERVRAKLKHYRAAVLKAAVEGTLTAEWRRQHPATESADALLKRILAERRCRWEEAQLTKFETAGKAPPKDWKARYVGPAAPDADANEPNPVHWVWTTLDACLVDGPQNGAYFHIGQYGSGIPILRIDDFQNGWIRQIDELRRVAVKAEDAEPYLLRDGDLVINRVNSMSHIGKCVVASTEFSGCMYESNMMRCGLSNLAVPRFVEIYLHSNAGRQRLIRKAKQAVNQASINQQDVRRTSIPIPPVAEQVAIVEAVEEQLSLIDHLERDLDAKLASAQALRQSILRHAFTGQLVPQDPNDEPASELLKRIAAEREERSRVLHVAKQAKPKPKAPRRRATKE